MDRNRTLRPNSPNRPPTPPPQVVVAAKRTSADSGRIEKPIKITAEARIQIPKVIVCRIFGVTAAESVGELLYKYFLMKLPLFLAANWTDDSVQDAISKIRDAIEESKQKEFPLIPDSDEKEQVIPAVVKFVDLMTGYKLENSKKKEVAPAFIRLRSMILTAGLREKDIENSHIYDDMPPAFRTWNAAGIRIATLSSTTKDAQRDYMTYTNHGDMTPYVQETISLMHPLIQTGDPKNPDFRTMCKKVIEVEPPFVLLLTSKISEVRAAQRCGMEVLLVSREDRIGKKPLSEVKRESVKDITIVKNMQSIVLHK